MPKLTNEVAKQVDGQEVREGFDRTPIDAGVYICNLRELTAKPSQAGNPMWVAVFEVVANGDGSKSDRKGFRLWANIVLTENSYWKVAQFFRAFGKSADTDTDMLLGKSIKLSVSKRPITSGAREGEIGNNVDSFIALEGTPAVEESKPATPAAAAVSAEEMAF